MKRSLDIALASLLGFATLPILGIAVLLIRLLDGRPILFRQERPGLDGKPFTIYKLRTMTEFRESCGNAPPDSVRLTPLGRWLRSTSIDELPTLWNVLRGDMSMVGP